MTDYPLVFLVIKGYFQQLVQIQMIFLDPLQTNNHLSRGGVAEINAGTGRVNLADYAIFASTWLK